MHKLRLLLAVFFVSLMSVSFAQQDAQFSQYMFNHLYYNPGFAGMEGNTRFTTIFRKQWLAYNTTGFENNYDGSSPTTQILSGSTLTPFLNKKLGVGMYMLYDVLGPLRTIDFNISASYLAKVKSGTLGIGLRGGISNQSIRQQPTDYWKVVSTQDEIYQDLISRSGRAGQTKPDMAAGLWYKTSKYYAGLSATHLLGSQYSYGFSKVSSRAQNHMYITGGYNFGLGIITLTPSTLIQTDFNSLTYLFGATGTYNDKFWAGFQLRESFAKKVDSNKKTLSNDDIVFLLGVNLLKNDKNENTLRIGYAFDFVTSGVAAKKRTSHEILLSYVAPAPWLKARPKVRTPRYRHEEN